MGYFLLCEQDLPTILTPLAYHDAHDGYDYYHGRNKGHMLIDDNVPHTKCGVFEA